jgi:hypothetical protein
MRIANKLLKIRKGTTTSNELGFPPSCPIRGVPNRWLISFSLRLPIKGAALPHLYIILNNLCVGNSEVLTAWMLFFSRKLEQLICCFISYYGKKKFQESFGNLLFVN